MSVRTRFLTLLGGLLLTACATGPADGPSAGSGMRPVLSAGDAGKHTVQAYLAKAGPLDSLLTDNWNPIAGVKLDGVKPDFVVAAGTPLASVQAAVNAAVKAVDSGARAPNERQYILVKPGVYNEALFVPSGVLVTLYGEASDASKTVITQKAFAGATQAQYHALFNPEGKVFVKGSTPDSVMKMYESCANRTGTMGTTCSAGAVIRSSGFEAKNLTWRNDFDESKATSGLQAVALMVDGADKVVFDNVRFIGHQDTLYVKSNSAETLNRAYFKACHVEGDVDFIFGRSAAVFDGCTIHFVSDRAGREGGYLIAPSTSPLYPYGFLFINSRFTADAATPAGSVYLGRSWDEGRNNKERPYEHGKSPNGQAVIRDSVIGAHIRKDDPWGPAASTNRPYDPAQNRFAEYNNKPAP